MRASLPLIIFALACSASPVKPPEPSRSRVVTQRLSNGLRVFVDPAPLGYTPRALEGQTTLPPHARLTARLLIPGGASHAPAAALSMEALLGAPMGAGLRGQLAQLGAEVDGWAEPTQAVLTLAFLKEDQAQVFESTARALSAPPGDLEAAKARVKRRCASSLRRAVFARLLNHAGLRGGCPTGAALEALSAAPPLDPKGALLYVTGDHETREAVERLAAWPHSSAREAPSLRVQSRGVGSAEVMSGPLGFYLLLANTSPDQAPTTRILAALWRRSGFEAHPIRVGREALLILELQGIEPEAALARVLEAPFSWGTRDLGIAQAEVDAQLRADPVARALYAQHDQPLPLSATEGRLKPRQTRALLRIQRRMLEAPLHLIVTAPGKEGLSASLYAEQIKESLSALHRRCARPSVPEGAEPEQSWGVVKAARPDAPPLAWYQGAPPHSPATARLVLKLGRAHEPQRARGGLALLAEALRAHGVGVQVNALDTQISLRFDGLMGFEPQHIERALRRLLLEDNTLDVERARAALGAAPLDLRSRAAALLTAQLEGERAAAQRADLDELTLAQLKALRLALYEAPRQAIIIAPGLESWRPRLAEALAGATARPQPTHAPRPVAEASPTNHLIEGPAAIWRAAYTLEGREVERWAALSLTAALIEHRSGPASITAEAEGRRLFITVEAPTAHLEAGIASAKRALAKIAQIGGDEARVEAVKARHLKALTLAWGAPEEMARVMATWITAGFTFNNAYDARQQIRRLDRAALKRIISQLERVGVVRLSAQPPTSAPTSNPKTQGGTP